MASRRFAVRVAKSVQEQEAWGLANTAHCAAIAFFFLPLGSSKADAEKEKNAALAAGYLSKARTRNFGVAGGTRSLTGRSALSCRAFASRLGVGDCRSLRSVSVFPGSVSLRGVGDPGGDPAACALD